MPFPSHYWNSLKNVGVSSSLNVWEFGSESILSWAYLCGVFFFLEIGSHYVVLADLELAMQDWPQTFRNPPACVS